MNKDESLTRDNPCTLTVKSPNAFVKSAFRSYLKTSKDTRIHYIHLTAPTSEARKPYLEFDFPWSTTMDRTVQGIQDLEERMNQNQSTSLGIGSTNSIFSLGATLCTRSAQRFRKGK